MGDPIEALVKHVSSQRSLGEVTQGATAGTRDVTWSWEWNEQATS